MDTHPSPADDLNDLERRLCEWRPSTAGLDADRMLFAAGRSSVRPGWGRIAWPVVSGCLALLAAALGVGLVRERTARLELAAQLQKPEPRLPAPATVPQPSEVLAPEPPAADSYLAARRALADNFETWLVLGKAQPAEGPPPPNRPILTARLRGELLEP